MHNWITVTSLVVDCTSIQQSINCVLDAVEHLQKKGASQIFIEKSIAMQEGQDQFDVRMSPMGSGDSLEIGAFADSDADSHGMDPCENLDLMPVDAVDTNGESCFKEEAECVKIFTCGAE